MITDAVQKDFPQFEYLTLINDYLPNALPDEYLELYEELLGDYSSEQLDYFRQNYGDKILWELYCDLCDPFSAHQK